MKKTILLLPILFVCACGSDESTPEIDPAVNTQAEHSNDEGKHESANEHMHNTSVDELVKRFESPERDAYQKPKNVMEFLGDLHGKTVMDIGAGSGYFSTKLAAEGAHVIAADVDDEFQDYLRERIETNGLDNIELRKIPYDSPALADNEADMVIVVNTYHHIEDRPEYFAKVKKGTKENGDLVIIDFFKAEVPVGPPVDHKISMDEVITELKKAGYTDFDVKVDLLPFQYIIRAK